MAVTVIASAGAPAHAQNLEPPLAQLDFDIVGVRLTANPSTLTVPKNIATQINTALEIPGNLGDAARAAIDKLTDGAIVEAEIRGPSLPTKQIKVKPGQPIPIPAFQLPGDYFLDRIRLTKNGETVLNGSPSTVPIKVIAQVLVTSVTSRPLSVQEIQEKGIVIDSSNFSVTDFQVAFDIEGEQFEIHLPVAGFAPTNEGFRRRDVEALSQLTLLNSRLAKSVKLPPLLDRPGFNFSVAPLPFFRVEGSADAQDLSFGPPPITGLVVIPGNIAFLNQFFTVQVIVSNVAPGGTPLILRDVKARIALPQGLDREAGTYDHPGDDPLRLARVQGVGQQSLAAVTQPGPDGRFATADDFLQIAPQESGRGEFLVEGLKEGAHDLDLEIDATLDGLPSGPVALRGNAIGSVLVRNPTFSITVAHPRVVRVGESYDLFVTVMNTSQTIANLVSVHLDPRQVSGSELKSDSTVQLTSIPPGESATATFRLLSQHTGSVTFTQFTADTGAIGRIELTTGVDERDVPLAPNAIALPTTTSNLPSSVVAAGLRVLGQALSVSTAPASTLPPGVLYIKRETVVTRGLELAEAGQRIEFGDTLPPTLSDLLLDWTGNHEPDDGFDQLLRTTQAGAAFFAEIGALLRPAVDAASALDFHRDLAGQLLGRAPVLTAMAGNGTATAPVTLRVSDSLGRSAARDGAAPAATNASTLPYAHVLDIANDDAGRTQLAVLAQTSSSPVIVEATGTGTGVFDLGVAVPLPGGGATELRYSQVSVRAGQVFRLVLDLASPGGDTSLQVDDNGDGVADRTIAALEAGVVQAPLRLVASRQVKSIYTLDLDDDPFDLGTYGIIIGALFNRPLDRESANEAAHYAVGNNKVETARLQVSGRIVIMVLQKPIGTWIPRQLAVDGVRDTTGQVVAGMAVPITAVYHDGAHVVGQVRTADGKPVPNALLNVSYVHKTFRADAAGSFDIDFVRRIFKPEVRILTQHPTTLQLATATATNRGNGQTMVLNPTFFGQGTVRGHVYKEDGVTPIAGVSVLVSSTDFGDPVAGVTNEAGEYVVHGITVGAYNVWVAGTGGVVNPRVSGNAQGLIPTAGAETTTDLVVVDRSQQVGRLVGRVFLADGVTPASGFAVYVGGLVRNPTTGARSINAVDQTTVDATGSFSFPALVDGKYDVAAFDPATEQLGVATTTVLPLTTSAVVIKMESFGSVEGVVLDAQGRPKAGALVAGGLELVTTDANGFFRVDDIPAGPRTLDAGDPVSKRRGNASVEVLPGETVPIVITLEARATIVGRVFDAAGNPVPKATVRIPSGDGYTFVFANNQGFYKFPDLPLGTYLIEAPGPPQEALIEWMADHGISPALAFTMGDAPPNLPGTLEEQASTPEGALAAYQHAVEVFVGMHELMFVGFAEPPSAGFGWNRVQLFLDSDVRTADIHYLRKGNVSGYTVDANGVRTAALVRLRARTVDSETGGPVVKEFGRLTTDPVLGEFKFFDIPLFDLATFQATGIRTGDFFLEAANPFSPVIVRHQGSLNANNPNLSGIVLQFPPASETNGTISGVVFMPDGVTRAPRNTSVHISFGDLTVLTDDDGTFRSQLPIPAGAYSAIATGPGGLTGQAVGLVPAGGNVDVRIRLLGRGSVTVTVKSASGQLQRQAFVTLETVTRLEGFTDANGTIRFSNVTEGRFNVAATEHGSDLSGRYSGTAVRDEDVAVTITTAPSGTVTGIFVGPDGRSPIANANVIVAAGAVSAFAVTDAAGRFEAHTMPIATFVASAIDPLTGRAGRATGGLRFEGDVADVVLVQLPRGSVEGFVFNADGITPIPGANVSLGIFQATARGDGRFRFDGVAAGAVGIVATDPVTGFTGTASTTLTFENETVEQSVTLEPWGAVRVTVKDEFGNPAGNVTLAMPAGVGDARLGATDANGQYTFTLLKLGTYRIIATSVAAPHNGAMGAATIDEANETAELALQLRGVGTVTVDVIPATGGGHVAGALVRLSARAASGDEMPRAFGAGYTAFTGADGIARFEGVPLGDFHVSASSGAVAGVATGIIVTPNQAVNATIQLGPAATIIGRILLPDGATPAALAVVTVTFESHSGLQSGVLQINTGVDGRFEFAGIPLGPYSLVAFEPVSSGVRAATGTLSAIEVRDLGDVVLDNTSPRILSIVPSDRATRVPRDASITVTFSEPLAGPGAVRVEDKPANPANFIVSRGRTRVDGSLELAADRRAVRFVPRDPLESSGVYTVIVKGGPSGPEDEAGLKMLDTFVSAFTAADTIPPGILSVSPGVDEQGVLPEAVVRVTFSEPISPGFSLTVSEGAQPIAGRVDLSVGNTVAIFTPADFLHANSSYTIAIGGVNDVEGNPLSSGVVTRRFFTVDTIAPTVSTLDVTDPGAAIGGGSVTIRPTFGSQDVQSVEYIVPGQAPRIVTAAPFTTTILLPSGVSAYAIQAIAIDRAGNRSDAITFNVPVAANQPPAVTLARRVPTPTAVAQGATIEFEATAADDVALSQLVLSAVGGAQYSSVLQVPTGAAQFSTAFSVSVPDNAPSNGSVTVQAAAVDSVGNRSAPATITIPIRDAVRPTVAFSSPVENAAVLAGQPLAFVVTAADDIGIASLAVSCAPALSGCVATPVSAAASVTQTLSVAVPIAAAGTSITLTAIATDAAGNVSTPATRTVRAVDTIAPVVGSLQLAGGGTQVQAGQRAVVRAQASDNASVAAVVFTVSGAFAATETVVVPAAPNTVADFAFTPPASIAAGTPLTVRAVARDGSGNSSSEALLALTVTAANTVPIANAGADQAVPLGAGVHLDGAASTDAQGSAITYRWSFASRPAGSTAALDAPTSPTPAFTADRPGAYVVELVVNDGLDDSAPDTVVVTTLNTRPVANAGADQTAPVGATVTLDGAASSDADGDALTYRWTLQSRPAASNAALANDATVAPTLTIDAPGSYAIQLVVNDGKTDSVADTVLVSTINSPPVANAGADQSAQAGQTVTVSGAASSDVDGNALTFAWAFVARPAGSNAVLSDPTAVAPTFVVDRAGAYQLRLIVNDGVVSSQPDVVIVTTDNSAPIANAGADQSVFVTSTVALDGSGSTDVNGDALTYAWSLTTRPAGSNATLSDPTAVAPTFVIDRAGIYVVQLIVNDGVVSSAADTVTITTLNTAPIANAGPDQSVVAGQLVLLNGSSSSDVDGQTLTYQWAFTARPPDSVAVLANATTAGPSFTADRPGTYLVQVIVHDGVVASAPDTMTISTTNTTPVANAGVDRLDAVTSTLVTLDGTASADADGQALSYSWSLVARPVGSAAVLAQATTASPVFTPDVAGDYVAQLVVSDGFVDSAPDTVLIRATAFETPVVTVQASDATASEVGLDPATLIVSRTGASTLPLTVLLTRGGTATAGDDYASFPLAVTLASGQSSAAIVVTPLSDAISEGPETVSVAIAADAAYAVGAPASATVTIEDAQSAVIIATDPIATEGGDTAAFTISRSGPTTSFRDVSVAFAGGTATLGADYNFSNNASIILADGGGFIVRIPAGQTSTTVAMTAVSDVVVDPDETVVLRAEATTATATITDVPPPFVTIAATDPFAYEVGSDKATFTISRTGPTTTPLDVRVPITGGSATPGTDYNFSNNTSVIVADTGGFIARIPAGESSVTVSMTPVLDALSEPLETVIVSVSLNPGSFYAVGTPASATASLEDLPSTSTLIDFEDLPAAMSVGTPIPSGYRGITWANWLKYALVAPSFYLPRGNAVYAAVDGARLSFAPRVFLGAWFGRCSCGLNGAVYFELYRAGSLVATSAILPDNPTPGVAPQPVFLASGYAGLVDEVVVRSLGASMTASGSGWFMDELTFGSVDASLPAISIVATDSAASESGPDPGTFTISRTGDTTQALTVNLSRSGTATAASDYVSFPLFATLPAGAASTTIAVTPIADGIGEGAETVTLAVAPSLSYYAGDSPSDSVVIVDSGTLVGQLVDFEDLPDVIPGPPATPFPSTYHGITWTNWQHYEPLPATYQQHGANAIYIKVDGASFAFSERVFLGASFTRAPGFTGAIYFEMYLDGALVATSGTLADVPPQLTFLPSGYGGPVDEVRVRSLGNTVNSNGSAWVMDDVLFGLIDTSRPVVSIAAADSTATEGQPDPATFTITRSGSASSPLTVTLMLSGSAAPGVDYSPVPTTVTIPAGQTSASVVIAPLSDSVIEGTETVIASLSPSSAYYVGAVSATATIVDDTSIVALVLDFEDQPDSISVGTSFPSTYRGITWVNWQHYAPLPAQYQPRGVNAIFPRGDGARIEFPTRPFLGAWFKRDGGHPGDVYFEMYRGGVLVATSAMLENRASFAFLSSGYGGPVDEVRVRCPNTACLPGSSYWVMDDVAFGPEAAPAPAAAPFGMVGWWSGDDLLDRVTGLAATNQGATFAAAKVGQGFVFANAGVISAPATSALDLTAVTIEGWIQLATLPTSDFAVLSKGITASTENYGLYVRYVGGIGELVFENYNGGFRHHVSSGAGLMPGALHHVAVTASGTTVAFYVDGRFVSQTAQLTPLVPNTLPLQIGSAQPNFGNRFNGVIDELSIYNRALSAAEIAQVAGAGALGKSPDVCTPAPAGLVSLWTGDNTTNDALNRNNPIGAQVGYAAGRVGQGMTFADSSSFDIPASPTLANQRFSVSAWVRPDGAGPNNDQFGSVIFGTGANSNNSVALYWRAIDNRFVFTFGDIFAEAVASTRTFAPGQFRFVTATYDGTTFRLYVDGALEASRTLTKTLQFGPSWAIGITPPEYRTIGFSRRWNGVIDEVAMFDRALDAGEIQSMMAGSGGVCR